MIKSNATITTEQFGEVDRKKYKSFIECYVMYKHILCEIKEHGIPLRVTFEVDEKSIYRNYIDRIEGNKPNDVSKEQRKFELQKSLDLIGHIVNYVTSIRNR